MSKQRLIRRVLTAASALSIGTFAVLGGLASPVSAESTALPSDVVFQQWADATLNWTTGGLNFSGANAAHYAEGETVPFLLDVTSVGAGSWSFSLCRDYMDGANRGYLSLQPFNTSRTPVVASPITDALGAFSGAAAVGSVHIDSVNEVGGPGACGPDQRETQVQITIGAGSGGAAPADAYVLWGGHLASPADAGVGIGHGASQYNGATLSMQVLTAKKTLVIKVAEAATITVQKVVDSGTAQPDQFCFNISPNPAGIALPLCPAAGQSTVAFLGLTTGSYTVTEAGLAGYTFASGTDSSPNCEIVNGVAAAGVTAASTAVDATCVFHNRLETVTGNSGSDPQDPPVTTPPDTTPPSDPQTPPSDPQGSTPPAVTPPTDPVDPTTIIDDLPGPDSSSSTTTTTTRPKKQKPTDDDNPGNDDWTSIDEPTTSATTTTTAQAPVADPGTSVSGVTDQTATPAPEQVLAGVVERPVPGADPAPAGGMLPRTGSGIAGEVLLGFILLAAGVSLRITRRRRPASQR